MSVSALILNVYLSQIQRQLNTWVLRDYGINVNEGIMFLLVIYSEFCFRSCIYFFNNYQQAIGLNSASETGAPGTYQ